jgi:hypothetical protein
MDHFYGRGEPLLLPRVIFHSSTDGKQQSRGGEPGAPQLVSAGGSLFANFEFGDKEFSG